MSTLPSLSVFCDCGCANGFQIKVIDNIGYLSFVSGDFNTKQKRHLIAEARRIAKDRMRYGQKKNLRFLKDIILTEDDLNALDNFLKENIETEELAENDAKIRILYDPDFGYTLYLIAKREGIFNILYRMRYEHRHYDLVINNQVRNELRKQIKRAKKRKSLLEVTGKAGDESEVLKRQ